MNNKVTKSSFLIKKTLLPDLIKFLEVKEIRKTSRKKFQIFSAKIMNSQLIIYKSGIVIFEESLNLIKMLEEFFVSTSHPIPRELETTSIRLTNHLNAVDKIILDEEISSYWLSTVQIEILMARYQKRGYEITSVSTKNYQHQICKSKTSCAEISKNGIMKSNSISDYKSDLDFVLENYPVDSKGQFFVGVESIGKYSQLGPIVYSIVGINSEQSILLQQNGIRHMKIGRNSNPDRYFEDITKFVVFQSHLIINPEEVNSDNYQVLHSIKFNAFISQIIEMIPDPITTTIYYDKSIKHDVLNLDLLSEFTLQESEDSMSSGAASIIAKYHYEHWLKDRSEEFKLLINKTNIGKILELPQKIKLLKLKYL